LAQRRVKQVKTYFANGKQVWVMLMAMQCTVEHRQCIHPDPCNIQRVNAQTIPVTQRLRQILHRRKVTWFYCGQDAFCYA
jgi:hypothetical protein